MRNVLLAATAALSFLLVQPHPATSHSIRSTQLESPATVYYPVQYGYPGQGYDDDEDDDNYGRISCWEGRRVVRSAGYRDVHNLSCYGEIYRYTGVRGGFLWRISVDADSGDIVRARRIRPLYTAY